MKKGLLTLLAASLVFVGCQNYDDQFDDLNAQISALKSQVDGLSALSSQVSSLSGTISGLQAGISAAQAAAAAAGTSADAATAAATAAGTNAVAAAAAAEAAAAEAATAAAAATTAATTAGADAVAAAAEAAAAATAAGETAAAAAAAAEAAATAAGASAVDAAELATAAAEAAGADAVAAAAEAAAAATAAGETATAAAAAAQAAAEAAGADAVAAAALAEAAADAATAAAGANTTSLTTLSAAVDALAADLAAVQASIATVSTAAEVAALQAEIDAIEADLEELMNSSNVYQGGITIASATNLDAVYDLGNAINIVNGNVLITNSSAYDQAKIQAVINRMITVNGTYTFTDIADAVSANTASPTFDTMTSVGDVTMTEMNGAVSFAALQTSGEISITGDSWDHDGDEAATTAAVQAITSFSAPLLDTADAISVNGADQITLGTVGTSININSLASVQDTDVTGLSITTGAGGTLTAAALTTPLDSSDDLTFALTIAGLASYTAPAGITGGTLTVSETPTLVVDGFQGTIDINTGVTSFTGTDVTNVDVAGADELVTASIDYAAESASHNDYDATDVTAQGEGLGSLSIDSNQADLTTLTVSGNVNDVTIAGSSVVSVTISATMDVLSISTSDDLTGLDVSDATIGDIVFNDNDAIVNLTLDNATNLAYTGTADALTGVTLTVTNSDDLESFTVSGTSFDDVDITGNSTLSTVDLSGVTAVAAGANVQVTGNDLNAASITETDASETEGSIDDGTSGMDTLTALMTALSAQTAAVATIRFDSAETITAEAGEVNNGNDVAYVDGTGNDALLTVYVKAAGTAAGTGAVTEGTQTTAVGVSGVNKALVIALNGVNLALGTMTGTDFAADVTTVMAQANVDAALAAGGTLTAKRGYNSQAEVTVAILSSGATALAGERYTTTAAVTAAATTTGNIYGLGKADAFTLTVGDDSVTATFGADFTTPASIVDSWDTNWPTDSVVTLSQTGALTFDINAVSSILDSSSYDLDVSISVTDSTTASSKTSAAFEYTIGSTRATNDNSTVDRGIIVQFTSTAAGATNNSIVTVAAGTGNAATLDVLTAGESPVDGATGVDGVAGAAGTTGITTDLSSWL